MKARWVYPFLFAVALGWLVSRPGRPAFVRVPAGGGKPPAWTMPDLEGRPVADTNFFGQVVVLNFWATWCPPCLRELPELKAFHQAHAAEGVVVIGAATDEGGAAKLKPFVERNGLNYPVLLADPEVQQAFGVTSLPSTWIVGRDRRVAARYLGALTREELERAVKPLLAAPPGTPAPGTPPPSPER